MERLSQDIIPVIESYVSAFLSEQKSQREQEQEQHRAVETRLEARISELLHDNKELRLQNQTLQEELNDMRSVSIIRSWERKVSVLESEIQRWRSGAPSPPHTPPPPPLRLPSPPPPPPTLKKIRGVLYLIDPQNDVYTIDDEHRPVKKVGEKLERGYRFFPVASDLL